ncbi:MAG: hypothetical protein JWO12_2292 [Frankiales bacterium]|nr:hypothetical protein [Frankiales bacterium]
MASGGAPDQIAYLSNRPEVLAETLGYVRHFMPWVRQAVVLCPTTSLQAMRRSIGEADIPEVVIVDEDSLLSGRDKPVSHTARNAFLRKVLAERGPLDDVFLQSDDDYRPLKPVAPSLFFEDGRILSYAFYDLALWRRNESTYDAGQHASYLALSYLGAGHLCFASHMPQALDKQLFLEAFEAAARLTDSTELCEWSLPLNHGRLVAPERFGEVRTFRTMCWPQYPHEWPYWQRPEDLTFENFYPELYRPGHLFEGIATALDTTAPEKQAFEKITRWHRFDLEAGRLRFPPGVANPWVTSPGRRAFFGAARRARKLYEYVALEERTQLAELAGQIAKLEQKP